ncbi:MAG: NAD(P)-dependent dehydrogenase (short-subunit alcohol dehydrogenase family) [Planctomycetota bacterium]|jgi:NAD(P)-dependent dehydrogenase (short-subunit alcohol dehydrogenase family)
MGVGAGSLGLYLLGMATDASNSPRESGTSGVILVTGSARGIGLGVARFLAAKGARVHVVWRSEGPTADSLVEEFGARAHRADLTGEADAVALVKAVVEVDGRLDGLVHAVGPYRSGALGDATADDLRHLFGGNVESAFHIFQAARESLREAKGSVVFFGTSGLEGMRARRLTALYAAAKSALRVLVKSWALEEAPHGLRVNMVSPGHVPHADAHADTLNEKLLASIPMGRPGTSEDLAQAVSWLLSSASNYSTGVDLSVTGGWLL